jgi:hypothetical protein
MSRIGPPSRRSGPGDEETERMVDTIRETAEPQLAGDPPPAIPPPPSVPPLPPSAPLLHTLTGHRAAVRAVAITADGKRAVSGSDDSR